MRNESEMTHRDPLADGPMLGGTLKVKIMGVGGAGANAVDRMKMDDLQQIHLTVVDTDAHVLGLSPVEEKIQLGDVANQGKSAGGNVDYGKRAAENSEARIHHCLEGVDLLFLLAGMGGGTGSGAAPVIAEIAADHGILVVAFVSMPFKREGKQRSERAQEAVAQLRKHAHAVVPLPNDVVFAHVDPEASLMEAFCLADKFIKLGVQSIWSMLFQSGLMNVDFATLQNAMSVRGGRTLFGTGYARGENLVEAAFRDLESCPLLNMPENPHATETDQLILHITGGPDLTMAMVDQVMAAVAQKFSCENSLIIGAAVDGAFLNQLRLTILGNCRARTGHKKGFEPVPSASIAPNEPVAKGDPRTGGVGGEESVAGFINRMPGTVGEDGFATADAAGGQTQQRQTMTARAQGEFRFAQEDDNRGLFSKMRRNLHAGQDLDIPTYIRRGVRLPKV